MDVLSIIFYDNNIFFKSIQTHSCSQTSKYVSKYLKGSASNNDVMMTDLQKKLGLFLYGTG